MTWEMQRRWLELRSRGRKGGFSPAEQAEMDALDRAFDEHDRERSLTRAQRRALRFGHTLHAASRTGRQKIEREKSP